MVTSNDTKGRTWLRALDHARTHGRPLLLAVCNVTPDSFSDGGLTFSAADARAHVMSLLGQGADVLDLGAESTRPGALPVSASEQILRLTPALEQALAAGARVSIDTASAEVAEYALEKGAIAINDTSCGREPELGQVVAKHQAAYLLMHARGPMANMRGFSNYPEDGYGDVARDVLREWQEARAKLLASGVAPEWIVFDAGLGFAKNAAQSLTLLKATAWFRRETNGPVLVGASRKSFLKIIDEALPEPRERLGASLWAAGVAAQLGADALRVHDVRATKQFLAGLRCFWPESIRNADKRSAAESESAARTTDVRQDDWQGQNDLKERPC
jgi:dihydropteroate synthase